MFTARVTDAVGVTFVEFRTSLFGCTAYAPLVSGTATDGVWSGSCVVPGGANSGTYNITTYAVDDAGNEALRQLGTFPVS